MLLKLSDSDDKSVLVTATPTAPPRNKPTPPQICDAAVNVVVSAPNQNHKERRQQRRAAKKRLSKSNKSPEEKVAAAEAFLTNITNQAAAWPRQKVPSSQRAARLAYKAARKAEMENDAQEEEAALAATFQGCGYSTKLTEQQIKRATINRTIPTAVVDSGASTTCVKPEEEDIQESLCGGYKWKSSPHQKTGKKSNKIFCMAMGHTAPGDDVVELPLPIRGNAREAHTVRGIQNNLYSLNRLVEEGYVPIFEHDGFKVYDATNTKIRVTRDAVLRGYYCPDEGLWRIPLLNKGIQAKDTATFRQSPQEILQEAPPPATRLINNVYEL